MSPKGYTKKAVLSTKIVFKFMIETTDIFPTYTNFKKADRVLFSTYL